MHFKISLILYVVSIIKLSFGNSVETKISDDPYDVDYTLYTRRANPFRFKIDVNPQDLLDNGFDISKLTKIITHGWVQDGDEYCKPFIDAYIGILNGKATWNLKVEFSDFVHCTEVRFASLLSGGSTTMTEIYPPEKKLSNCTSVHWGKEIRLDNFLHND